ncbi:unnamed protein product, partial [Didymodactylos carnosus]
MIGQQFKELNVDLNAIPFWSKDNNSDIVKLRSILKQKLFKEYNYLLNETRYIYNKSLAPTTVPIIAHHPDLTTRKLSRWESNVLELGLNFIPTTGINTTKYVARVIAGIES